MSQTFQASEPTVAETPLAARLSATESHALQLKMHRGARTPLAFSGISSELEALSRACGLFDLGYRAFLRVTGKDRVRWLNGMITQTVKSLSPGQTAYTLVLNPQGRIQGDADLYCREEFLLLETDRSQSERLLAHLRRFIIMDDVKLEELDAAITAIGIAGPRAPELLRKVASGAPESGSFSSAQIAGINVTLAHLYSPVVPRFEIHLPSDRVLDFWRALLDAGAVPCGLAALEDFRVLEGVPLYDVDFSDKHLPQETGLLRALNFTKGCYIGQEIVERIRSRATVHRALRQFELTGPAPNLARGEKIELRSADAPVGELTSVAAIDLPGFSRTLALGVARIEALDKSADQPIVFQGGTAAPLAQPPQLANS